MTRHVTIYRQPGRFAGWPANHGIWCWGDEILVGFVVGRFLDREGRFHAIDTTAPRGITFGRSRDGGETWAVEDGAEAGLAGACYNHTLGDSKPIRCPGTIIDFTGAGFAAIFGRLSNAKGPSSFHLSVNRGRTWLGPYLLPDMGTPGIAARTSYVVEGPGRMRVFLTCAKEDGKEGDSVCAGTCDGGHTWHAHSYIMRAPAYASAYGIMPSAINLDNGRFICAVRHQWYERKTVLWDGMQTRPQVRMSCIEILDSVDGGSWQERCDIAVLNAHSSPGWLVDLKDGRVCCVYTVREEPYRICAAIAPVDTLKFGSEIVVCDDAVSRDIGYTVACRRPDGKLVIVYYWHDSEESPERYIRATIWEPPE